MSNPTSDGQPFGIGSPEVKLSLEKYSTAQYALKFEFTNHGLGDVLLVQSRLTARWALEDIRKQADDLLKEHFPEHREPHGRHELGRPEDEEVRP